MRQDRCAFAQLTQHLPLQTFRRLVAKYDGNLLRIHFLTDRSIIPNVRPMARHKEFDRDMAIDAAIAVFREHGFEGASTGMLVEGMGIGRQSLYDTFGDKWQLYQAALQRYAVGETAAHATALKQGPRAIDGIHAMLARVVEKAMEPCLGVSAICEFGRSKPELSKIQDASARALRANISKAVQETQAQDGLAGGSDPGEIADFLVACIAGIRIAARGGAGRNALNSLARHAMLALR